MRIERVKTFERFIARMSLRVGLHQAQGVGREVAGPINMNPQTTVHPSVFRIAAVNPFDLDVANPPAAIDPHISLRQIVRNLGQKIYGEGGLLLIYFQVVYAVQVRLARVILMISDVPPPYIFVAAEL